MFRVYLIIVNYTPNVHNLIAHVGNTYESPHSTRHLDAKSPQYTSFLGRRIQFGALGAFESLREFRDVGKGPIHAPSPRRMGIHTDQLDSSLWLDIGRPYTRERQEKHLFPSVVQTR